MLAPGTAYVIPARVGVWLVGAVSWGSDVRLRFVIAVAVVVAVVVAAVVVVAACARGRCFSRYVSGDGDHTDAFS